MGLTSVTGAVHRRMHRGSKAGVHSGRARPPRRRLGRIEPSIVVVLLGTASLTAFAPATAATIPDPFPVLLDTGDGFELPLEARPGYLMSNTGRELPARVWIEDGDGGLVFERRTTPGNNLTFVADPSGGTHGPADAGGADVDDGVWRVRTDGLAWVAWVPEWRLQVVDADEVTVACPLTEPVAVLWEVTDARGFLTLAGTGTGLEVFVYHGDPLRIVARVHDDLSFESGLLDGGPGAFWLVVRPSSEECAGALEASFAIDDPLDLNAFVQLRWLLLAGVIVMVSFFIFGRPPREFVGRGRSSKAIVPVGPVLWAAVGLALLGGGSLIVPSVDAHGSPGFEAGALQPGRFIEVLVPGERGGHVCVQGHADGAGAELDAGRLRILQANTPQSESLDVLVPLAPDSLCVDIESGHVEFVGEVRGKYVMMPSAPRSVSAPGGIRIEGPTGGAALLRDATGGARIDALIEAGWGLHVLDASSFELLGESDQAGEVIGVMGPDADVGRRDLWVVATNSRPDGAGDVRISWVDPDWFALTPTFGHLVTVGAVCLFVVLFRRGARS